MIDRLMPIFALIGVLSTFCYAGLAVWAVYSNINELKKKRNHSKHHAIKGSLDCWLR